MISTNVNKISTELNDTAILNEIIRLKDYKILNLKNFMCQMNYERDTDFQG